MSASATHATIGVFDMDPSRRAAQERGLTEVLIPSVTKVPGFVTGYWTRSIGADRSYAVVLFDSLAAAEGFASNVRGNAENQAANGVTLVSFDVTTITGTGSAPTS